MLRGWHKILFAMSFRHQQLRYRFGMGMLAGLR